MSLFSYLVDGLSGNMILGLTTVSLRTLELALVRCLRVQCEPQPSEVFRFSSFCM